MRRELGIENQSVHVFAYKGRIEILSEARYTERTEAAAKAAAAAVETLEDAGLQ